ncbi:MAG: DUF1194 domain-containing protein [Shimia sp.]|uniref:DUF1194 domain-containing protein n=1 Tax=Shimia sp. TaxID=1954381 RepID=UPI004059D7FE
MIFRAFFFIILLMAPAVRACDIALLLAVDVSGSVDAREYRVQMDGLAAGLRDGVVVEALIKASAAVSVMQWTGAGRQEVSLDWTRVRDAEEAETLALAVESMPRAWSKYSTAIGDALWRGADLMEQAPECRRKVVDVSGDGRSNEGMDPAEARARMARQGVTVNALVIETDDTDLTGYFWENVITGPGAFVVTANGFEDYPKRIEQKLIREVAEQFASYPQKP